MFASSFVIVAPIFALVAIGYAAARTGLAGADGGTGVSAYVFTLAIPALMFRTIAAAPFPPINPTLYWIAYFTGIAIVWTVASAVARHLGRDRREAAIMGFAAGQSNTVFVGIPLILGLLGEAGNVPIILLIGIHLPVTLTIATLIIAREEGSGRQLFRSLALNPILVSILAGIVWRLSGYGIHPIAGKVLKLLADTAGPAALVAMGMSLTRVSLAGNFGLISIISTLKLLIHPAIVYFLAVKIFALPPGFAAAAVLFAACPTGINAYLLADRYRSGAATVSGTIAFSTLLAIVTTTLAVTLVMPLVH